MTRDKFNCYFSFWASFCPFTPLRAWKIKFQKKWEKLLEISSFYTSVPKLMTIYFPVPEICHVADIIIFHFGQFFALPPPLTTQKMKISKKKWKKCLEISFFNTIVPKIMIICYTVPEIQHVTDAIVIFQFGIFFALLSH